MNVPCHFCGDQIDPDERFHYQRVVGWERKAAGGTRRGGSDITLRERREEFACGHCVNALKKGRTPSQGSLI